MPSVFRVGHHRINAKEPPRQRIVVPLLHLRLQFEAVSQLPPEEQSIVKEVLESLIIKYQTRRWDKARATVAAVAPTAKVAPAAKAAKVASKAMPAKRADHAGGHR